MSASINKRSKLSVLGDYKNNIHILEANVMNENYSILLAILHTRLVGSMAANPGGTWYFEYPAMAFVMSVLGWTTLHTWMKAFNHFSPKPTLLTGSISAIGQLKKVWSKRLEAEQKQKIGMRLKSMKLDFGRKTAMKTWLKRAKLNKQKANNVSYINANGHTCGGSGLRDSGEYTPLSCKSALLAWEASDKQTGTDMSLREFLEAIPCPMRDYKNLCETTPKKVQALFKNKKNIETPEILTKPSLCLPLRFTARAALEALLACQGQD